MENETSLIPMHPFFRKFVLSIITTIRERGFEDRGKFVIDADLVPRVSENVMRASMGAGVVRPAVVDRVKVRPVRIDMSGLVAPIESPQPMRASMNVMQAPPRRVMPPRMVAPPIQRAPVPQRVIQAPAPVNAVEGPLDKEGAYGKISPLLNDPSVSTIECIGKDKELMIVRAGQKQRTRIVLSANDIKGVLNKVADDAHIPLIEGVFRASLKGFSINAVISEMIGSRFVIKKATAYGLLE